MSEEILLVVVCKTNQQEIQRRIKAILEAAWPESGAELWARGVDELNASDLSRLAAIIGWDAVRRLVPGGAVELGA